MLINLFINLAKLALKAKDQMLFTDWGISRWV